MCSNATLTFYEIVQCGIAEYDNHCFDGNLALQNKGCEVTVANTPMRTAIKLIWQTLIDHVV